MTAISQLTSNLRPYVSGCINEMIDKAVWDALFEFYNRTGLLTYGIDYEIDANDVDSYENDSVNFYTSALYSTLNPCRVKSFYQGSTRYELEFLEPSGDIEHLSGIVDTDGRKYYFFPEDQAIRVYPVTPAETGLTHFFLEVVFTPASTATTINTQQYNHWHETIEAGALFRLQEIPGKPWSDPRSAMFNRAKWENGIGSAQGFVRTVTANRNQPQRMSFL